VHILMMKGAAEPGLVWGREVIERQAKHLSRLIDDLLDVARIGTGKIQLKPVPLDLREIVTRAVESVWPLMTAKHHDLQVDLAPEPLWTQGDPVRLEQVMGNLLTNAAKYTDEKGLISLSVGREGPSIVLRVRDNGIGIAREMLPRIFDLYAQAEGHRDRSQGGVGIGLTLVKRLVELHSGSVSVASEGPGLGSEFTVILPAIEAPASGPRDDPPMRPAPAAPVRTRVLVVDDNVDVALGLSKLVEDAGHEVSTAHDGESALEIARDFRPRFVLMDIGLPGRDGYELARAFRAEGELSDTVLIAISGYGQHQDQARALAAGFEHHFVKPIDLEALLPILAGDGGAGPRASEGNTT